MAASFNGCLDEVAAYTGVVSPVRIKQHYDTAVGASGRYPTEINADNPVGYWRLNDPGSTALDSSGHSLTGAYALSAASVNLSTNPSAETDTTGWNQWYQSGTPSRSTAQAKIGGASIAFVAPVGYAKAVQTDSPVSYWHLDEALGTTASDSADTNPGTYTGGFTLGAAGAIAGAGTAVTFNGTTGYVNVPDAANLRVSTAFTLEAWVKPTDRLANYPVLAKSNTGTDRAYELLINTSGFVETFSTGPGGFASNSTIPTGAWTHIVVTYDGTSLRYYINGALDKTVTASVPTAANAQPFRIGSRGLAGECFKGSIDEPAIYNTALSGTRIAAHYSAGPNDGTVAGVGTPWSAQINTVYSSSLWVRVPAAGTWRVRYQDGNTSFAGWSDQSPGGIGGVTTTGAAWVQFTWTAYTTPGAFAPTNQMIAALFGSTDFNGETIYMDGQLVVNGPLLPNYFDGNTPGAAWDGTPNDSISRYGFNTQSQGALNVDNTNTVALYLREVSIDEDTQLNINTLTMGALDAMKRQPDYARNKWTSRTQADIDPFVQSDLDPDTQFDLERKPNYIFAAWLEVKLKWSGADAVLSVSNLNGVSYSWSDVDILANRDYIIFVDLVESSIRTRIFQLDSIGNLDTTVPMVYDTTRIIDESLAKRRKGRIGWWGRFADGDAFVSSVRPRGFNFAQLRTHGFASDTAVSGTQLSVQQSPDRNLVTGASPGPFGGTLSLETVKSKSGEAIKVVNKANLPLQGLQTNPIYFSDMMMHLSIDFDLFFPSSALVGNPAGGLEVFLYGEFGRIVPLVLPPFAPDAWQHIVFYPDFSKIQTGLYSLMILESLPNVDATWYVDNLKVIQRTIAWWGKGQPNDAWKMRRNRWAPLSPVLNTDTGGGVFDGRGTALQLRAEARQQDGFISDVKAIPKYAELGDTYWRDQEPTLQALPVSSFTFTTAVGHVATFTSTGTSPGRIATWYWTFGDGGTDYGSKTVHTYDTSGTYPVSLTVIDNQGQQVTSTQNVTI